MLWDCFWGHFWHKAALQLSVICTSSHVWLICIDVHMPLLKSPNFWISSVKYYIGLLSLERGHNPVAKLDTRAPGSLGHAARLETSWSGQWLRYLAAVVSICEYTVSGLAVSLSWLWAIVGAMPPRLIFCGSNCPHCSPQFRAAYVSISLMHVEFELLEGMQQQNTSWTRHQWDCATSR